MAAAKCTQTLAENQSVAVLLQTRAKPFRVSAAHLNPVPQIPKFQDIHISCLVTVQKFLSVKESCRLCLCGL